MTDLSRLFSTNGLVPLAGPKLTTLDGFVGVFTPIAEQGPTSPPATDNLQALVDRLTSELTRLQERNIALQGKLDKALAPATSSDDLASALQRTVNRLQSELASLSNPVSNFAVKDFRLETSLTVSITELGSVEFRLLQPGANVDPSAISKLTLSLVPIEKQLSAGTFASSLFEPDKDLSTIGVAPPLREILERNHIFTIGEFRTAAMRSQVRTLLTSSERATRDELVRLQARAELVLLAGVDLEIADTLINANITTLRALGASTPAGLALVLPRIDARRLAHWIDAAKVFDGDGAASEETQHIVSVSTEPANLLVRLGSQETFSQSRIVRRLPAGQVVTPSTLRTQMLKEGAGYRLESWSTGEATPSISVSTPNDVTETVRFALAGYWVLAASASPGGTVTLSPTIGGLPQLPASCYRAGTTIEVIATPERDHVISTFTIKTLGTTRTVRTPQTSVVVDGPVTALATFMPRPATISSIFAPVASSAGFRSRVFFTNRAVVPGFDVRVTDVRFQTTGGSGTVRLQSALPIAFGDLPVDGKTIEQELLYDLPTTVTNFNIVLTVQLKNASGVVLTDERSIGHSNPGAAVPLPDQPPIQ
jgi:hypothetical protein